MAIDDWWLIILGCIVGIVLAASFLLPLVAPVSELDETSVDEPAVSALQTVGEPYSGGYGNGWGWEDKLDCGISLDAGLGTVMRGTWWETAWAVRLSFWISIEQNLDD